MANTRLIPAPRPHPDTQAFWDAAASGKFLLRRCDACGKVHWYPRAICPFCASAATQWVEASGRGTVYSYSVNRHADPPYIIAYVTLAEGPTMLTNLVDCNPEERLIGRTVRLLFLPTDGGPPVPVFTCT